MLSSRVERLKNANNLINSPSKSMDSFDFAHIQHDSNIRLVSIEQLKKAPDEWNFYKPLSDDKMIELIDSILDNGLLQPIVVWQQQDGNYMILAGHNRTAAYQKILETTNDPSYSKIPALIKNWSELNETTAREIIIDTNWVQRKLSTMEKAQSISQKYNLLLGNRKRVEKGNGKIRDKIAKDYNLSGRQVAKYKSLNQLINPFQIALSENQISLAIATKLANLESHIQEYIYSNYNTNLKSTKLKFITNESTKKEIDDIFMIESDNVSIKIDVPRHLAKDAKKMLLNWINEQH